MAGSEIAVHHSLPMAAFPATARLGLGAVVKKPQIATI